MRASDDMSTKPLYDFLLARFTREDLAQLVYFNYPQISAELPEGGTVASFTATLIRLLERHGLLGDSFFELLRKERPNFSGVVDSLHQHFAQGDNGGDSTPLIKPPVVFVFLGANPRDNSRLALDKERYRIEQVLARATHGRQAQVQAFMGASIEALRDVVRSYMPAVLHFSGHGNSDGELLLEGPGGATQPLNGDALAAWLETRKERPRLLVLNACHGARNALPLARAIDVVIGVTSEVSDDAAMTFSREFYNELGAGETVEQAFQSARAAVGTSHPGEEHLLQMNTRPGIRAGSIKFLG